LAAHAKLNVVTSLPDLAAIAREIGGDKVAVTSLARGTEDPHFVDPKPSFIRLLNQADVFIEGGAEMELGWLPPLLNNARNAKILGASPGHVLASRGVRLLEVPTGPVDRSEGDVHRLGNPHFLLDPANAKTVAATIAEALSAVDPANAAAYASAVRAFDERIDRKLAEWTKALEPFRGTKIVTYHKTFEYFADRFGLVVAGQIEPKPGIEPSPAHIRELIARAKQAGVKLVWIEPNRSSRTPRYVAESAGAKLLVLPAFPDVNEKTKDYFSLFDYNVSQIVAALGTSK
jgi:ABC-type Zn uptake system ZnuABC Zn-binding protein ZnuA